MRTALALGLFIASHAFAQDVLRPFAWRGIGPANMMGRIAAIDALDSDHRTVAVASASGGVFWSNNAGVTWTSIFDDYGAGSIGSVALFQNDPNVIWVGTGESANRNSSGWGDGIYRSTDGGRTFTNLGLEDTHQIAEIALHPTDPDIAWVAAVGHLWGYSGSRGLYQTADGGKTWRKLTKGLPDDGRTGCTEIIRHPTDPEVLFCGMYHRIRQPATMHSGGPNGGIFKSTDGGASWRKLTKGLPTGDTGMIDIAIHRANPDIMVANVEADEKLPDDLSVPGPGVYRSDDGGESWRYLLRHNTRPFYHGQVDIDPVNPDRIYAVSREFRVSRDGGKTWRNKWWGGGGDDHDFWISPQDPKVFYMATDQGAYLTVDDGRTLVGFDNMAIGQYYAIGVDMRDPYWVLGGLQDNGIWMGPSNSREPRGILNTHNTWVGEGDGFHSQIDPTDWRTAYFVNHCGFCARLNVETREHAFITPTPETVLNFADWADPDYPETRTRYTISPGEHWFFGERPDRPLMPPQFRFNWSSPLVLSKVNPRTLYFGSNHLFRSIDRGDTWRIISPDLTTNDPELRNPSDQGGLTRNVTGGENHCTIITIAESAVDPAVLWVGTDDGNVQVSRDAGVSWSNVRANVPRVPERTWVSRVEPSSFTAGTCYVTFDNHRHDDTKPYLFRTRDFGVTWTDLTNDLPDGSLYVVREDFRNPQLLFVGSEFGCHVSIDGGASWARFMNGLPTVAVHDLVIHPRDADLVAGTHGRSVWIADDVTSLQQLVAGVLEKDVHVFDNRVATKWRRIRLGRKQPSFLFRGDNPPRGALIHFWLKNEPRERVNVVVVDPFSGRRATLRARSEPGLQRVTWNFTFPPTPADITAAKTRLRDVVRDLDARVADAAARESLARITPRLDRAESNRQVESVRRALIRDFAVYAKGGPWFGPKLTSTEAAPGTYRVELEVDGETYSGSIAVRDDPLDR